jgi:hypothetical protein
MSLNPDVIAPPPLHTHNPSSCTMGLRLTQPLTEMHIRNIPGGEVQPVCKADNLTAIPELAV